MHALEWAQIGTARKMLSVKLLSEQCRQQLAKRLHAMFAESCKPNKLLLRKVLETENLHADHVNILCVRIVATGIQLRNELCKRMQEGA